MYYYLYVCTTYSDPYHWTDFYYSGYHDTLYYDRYHTSYYVDPYYGGCWETDYGFTICT